MKYFTMEFDYTYDILGGLIKPKGKMRMNFNNSFALAEVKLGATDLGHLYPQLNKLQVDLWETDI